MDLSGGTLPDGARRRNVATSVVVAAEVVVTTSAATTTEVATLRRRAPSGRVPPERSIPGLRGNRVLPRTTESPSSPIPRQTDSSAARATRPAPPVLRPVDHGDRIAEGDGRRAPRVRAVAPRHDRPGNPGPGPPPTRPWTRPSRRHGAP